MVGWGGVMPVNLSKFKKRVGAVRRGMDLAAKRALVAGADASVDVVESIAPVDTGRFLAGWQRAALKAGSAVGGKARMVQPIDFSQSRHERVLERLWHQVEFIAREVKWRKERLYLWYDSRGRRYGDYGRSLARKIKTWEKRYSRALEEFQKAAAAEGTGVPVLVIGSGAGRKLSTVRTKVYGGTGRLIVRGGGLVEVLMKNLEPHAQILEAKLQVMARARQLAGERERVMASFTAAIKRADRAG